MTLLSACGRDHVFIDGTLPDPPTDLSVQPRWVLEGFTPAGQPSGFAAVDLAWLPPVNWSNEVFRVYGRRAGSGAYVLIATVTSCTSNGCVYRDRNVIAGQSYEYYVATTDESSDQEAPTAFAELVNVPAAFTPAAPVADSSVALDNSAFLRWRDDTNGARLWKYQVYLTHVDGTASLYALGETDGKQFLDSRATNGHVYGYRVAAVDTSEHVSALSAEILVVPRPDALNELIYSFQTQPAESGFRFQTLESSNPILDGGSAQAQWRLEQTAAGWRIVPLNGTQVVEYGFTTALTCGPGADAGCLAVRRAPAAGYSSAPIPINLEYSYVFRVTGSDGQPHYGVIRADILGSDGSGHQLMIFDWAYQNIANDVRLDRSLPAGTVGR
jgi:hypothetical protein